VARAGSARISRALSKKRGLSVLISLDDEERLLAQSARLRPENSPECPADQKSPATGPPSSRIPGEHATGRGSCRGVPGHRQHPRRFLAQQAHWRATPGPRGYIRQATIRASPRSPAMPRVMTFAHHDDLWRKLKLVGVVSPRSASMPEAAPQLRAHRRNRRCRSRTGDAGVRPARGRGSRRFAAP